MNRYQYRLPQKKKSGKRAFLRFLLAVLLLTLGASYLFLDNRRSTQTPEIETPETAPSREMRMERPRVSVFLPLSGPFKRDGHSMKQGMEMAWEELQAEGFKGELVLLDIEGEDFDFLDAAQKAVADPNTLLLIVHGPSHILETLIPLCKTQDVALMTPAGSHEGLSSQESIITLVPSDRVEALHAGRVSVEMTPSRKVTVVHDSSRYAEILLDGFREGALQAGVPVKEAALDPGMKNQPEQLSEALTADLVFLAGTPLWGVEIARALSEHNHEGKLLVPQVYDSFALDDLYERYRDRLLVLRTTVGKGRGEESARQFLHKFVAKHMKEPNWPAALGYDAVQWIGDELRQDSLQRSTFKEKLLERFTSGKTFAGASGEALFGHDGCVTRDFEAFFYKDGKLVPVKDSGRRSSTDR